MLGVNDDLPTTGVPRGADLRLATFFGLSEQSTNRVGEVARELVGDVAGHEVEPVEDPVIYVKVDANGGVREPHGVVHALVEEQV